MQQPDMWISAYNLLSIDLENQSEHAVGSRMLRTEIDRIMPYLSLLRFSSVLFRLKSFGVVFVDRLTELIVDWNQARRSYAAISLSKVSRQRGRDAADRV